MKKTVIIRMGLFLFTLIAFLSATVFAWSTLVEKTQPIMFYSGRLEVEAKLYKLIDPNYDGLDNDNLYEEVTQSFTFTKLVPGQIITFKIETENKGTTPGYLSIEMVTRILSANQLAEVIELIYTKPDETLTTISPLSEKLLFFKNKLINQMQPNESNKHTFMFQMRVKPTLGNSLSNVNLVIDSFKVKLDQNLT